MTVGYALLGAIAGLASFLIAILNDASLWLSLGIYSLVGSLSMTLGLVLQYAGFIGVRNGFEEDFSAGFDARTEGIAGGGSTRPDTMRILAVDDDPFIREIIPAISATAGFNDVTTVASGEKALHLLANDDTGFDCFLFDINMPGMDGIDLCRLVRQIPHYAKTPIIMLTAMRDLNNIGAAFRAGATDYAAKPFEIEDLSARLRSAKEALDARYKATVAQLSDVEHLDAATLPLLTGAVNWMQARIVEGLVDASVMSNYLTQLPRKEAGKVRVFAVTIDRSQASEAESRPQQLMLQLETVAAETVRILGSKASLLACANDSSVLVVTSSDDIPSASELEPALERRLSDDLAGAGAAGGSIRVFVGGAVTPYGEKSQRSKLTRNHAIALAEQRARDRAGKPDTVLHKSG